MARPLRVEYEGAYYHVLARGNEGRGIFRDSQDYRRFVKLLGLLCERFEAEVWSYVLMDNHYHLILRTRQRTLSRAMQWLGVAYSVWHNRRHGRTGHLFQGRFKSFAICEEEYLGQLVLYIHRNPVRAGLVKRLADYPWSSYRHLGYGREAVVWVPRERVLRLFGGRGPEFRRAVQGYSEEKSRLLEDLRLGVFLGSAEGLGRLRRSVRVAAHREKPGSREMARAGTVAEDIEPCRKALGVSRKAMSALLRPVRGRERPVRDALIYAVWKRGHGLKEIGDYFGVGYSGVANARRRAEASFAKDSSLGRVLEKANDK